MTASEVAEYGVMQEVGRCGPEKRWTGGEPTGWLPMGCASELDLDSHSVTSHKQLGCRDGDHCPLGCKGP